jgi:flagellin-like hook-associated protein FlgL
MKGFTLIGLILFLALNASAQLSNQGIAGYQDKYQRNPNLTVGTKVNGGSTQILADTAILDPEYAQFPVRVDFFVNRKLFSSQYRSPGLPGNLGIEVPTSVAPLPFNYAVVATLMHPNRQFTTIIEGAVFANSISGTLDCTFSTDATSDTPIDYSASGVSLTQAGSDSVTIKFTGDSGDGTANLDFAVTVNGTKATATGTSEISGTNTSYSLSGTNTTTNGAIEALDLKSSDSKIELSCSKP